MVENIQFTVLIATTIFIILLLFFLLRLKNKSQLHYVFISIISLMIVWDFGTGLYRYFYINGHDIFTFIYVEYIGTCFMPVSILLMGIIFARTRVKFDYRYVLLFVVPVTTYSVLLTNQYHHLFFIKYSYIANDIVFGKYFIIHALYSYACILVGLSYLVYFSIRDFGIFSKQLIIILIGLFLPLIINVLFTLKILFVNQMSAPISFSIAIICFFIAIFKYDFLLVLPIAMRTVVDKISNCFVVIDLEFRVVDFNKTFIDTFSCIIDIKRKDNFLQLLENIKFINATDLKGYIEQVQEIEKPI
ncbi:MAG TPA: histidine kinase N-terminal 7TM domain-containing protein, partial [Clostridia bacterium]